MQEYELRLWHLLSLFLLILKVLFFLKHKFSHQNIFLLCKHMNSFPTQFCLIFQNLLLTLLSFLLLFLYYFYVNRINWWKNISIFINIFIILNMTSFYLSFLLYTIILHHKHLKFQKVFHFQCRAINNFQKPKDFDWLFIKIFMILMILIR